MTGMPSESPEMFTTEQTCPGEPWLIGNGDEHSRACKGCELGNGFRGLLQVLQDFEAKDGIR